MKKELFIGIDISKETIDVSFINKKLKGMIPHEVFGNNKAGFKTMFKWLKMESKLASKQMLVCMEHTGSYTLELCCFLEEQKITMCLENALQIKRSMGIQRGKSDKVDALMIAQYCYRYHDKLKEFKIPSKSLLKLRVQYAHRERLLKAKQVLFLGIKSIGVHEKEIRMETVMGTNKIIKQLDKELNQIGKSILNTIEQDPELYKSYTLLETIPGIGLQTITYFFICSNGGKGFDNARKFACYCGVAPFGYSSGSSIRGKSRVSYLANRKMKEMLHMASLCAVRFDEEMKNYYERKLKEGKNPMSILNAVKFKLIARMFSVLKREEPFRKNYLEIAA